MFGQTFDFNDLFVVAILVALEGVLSIDNALVLGLLAKRLPRKSRAKALSYGLIGAFFFRLIAVCGASFLLRWSFIKILGGAYLLYVSIKHFLSKKPPQRLPHAHSPDTHSSGAHTTETLTSGAHAPGADPSDHFWLTVGMIELTDIAFAVDSILAAIALVGPTPAGMAIHPKLWVVITGGMLGVVLMRVAAALFIRLLERFPRFEVSAYLLVAVIGTKLLLDWAFNAPGHERLSFQHASSPAFWILWMIMVACFAVGFLPEKRRASSPAKQ